MLAFLPTLGLPEMFLLLVIGLLLYGRNLPQAGRTMGRFVAQLKRGFQDFKDQMDRDESIREVRKTLTDTTREMRNLTALPRAVADPGHALRTLAHDTMTMPAATDADGAVAASTAEKGVEKRAEELAEEHADEPPPPTAASPTGSPTSEPTTASPTEPSPPARDDGTRPFP